MAWRWPATQPRSVLEVVVPDQELLGVLERGDQGIQLFGGQLSAQEVVSAEHDAILVDF